MVAPRERCRGEVGAESGEEDVTVVKGRKAEELDRSRFDMCKSRAEA